MAETSAKKGGELGYRRGVLLGLTIAEIILLLLFALLLALWSKIDQLNKLEDRARVINEKFDAAVRAIDANDQQALKAELDRIIAAEIDYSRRLAAEIEKQKERLLPTDAYEAIIAKKFDLTKPEDQKRLSNLMKVASEVAAKSGKSPDEIAASCQVADALKERLKGADPSEYLDSTIAQKEHWRKVAESGGKGAVLPPCYADSDGRRIFLYKATLLDDGIVLTDIASDEWRARRQRDFDELPTTGVVLSPRKFLAETSQFIGYGKRQDCRFFVDAYDETGSDKRNFQAMEKVLETNFYKKKNW